MEMVKIIHPILDIQLSTFKFSKMVNRTRLLKADIQKIIIKTQTIITKIWVTKPTTTIIMVGISSMDSCIWVKNNRQ